MSHNTQELMKNNTVQMEASEVRYKTLAEFYPFYLSQHENATCRRLHFVGTSCVIGIAAASVATGNAKLLWALPVVGYGFAWWVISFMSIINLRPLSSHSLVSPVILLCIKISY